MSNKKLLFSCPTCKLLVTRQEESFPFCSERCKVIDLGRWASGEYVIADNTTSEDEDQQMLH